MSFELRLVIHRAVGVKSARSRHPNYPILRTYKSWHRLGQLGLLGRRERIRTVIRPSLEDYDTESVRCTERAFRQFRLYNRNRAKESVSLRFASRWRLKDNRHTYIIDIFEKRRTAFSTFDNRAVRRIRHHRLQHHLYLATGDLDITPTWRSPLSCSCLLARSLPTFSTHRSHFTLHDGSSRKIMVKWCRTRVFAQV